MTWLPSVEMGVQAALGKVPRQKCYILSTLLDNGKVTCEEMVEFQEVVNSMLTKTTKSDVYLMYDFSGRPTTSYWSEINTKICFIKLFVFTQIEIHTISNL